MRGHLADSSILHYVNIHNRPHGQYFNNPTVICVLMICKAVNCTPSLYAQGKHEVKQTVKLHFVFMFLAGTWVRFIVNLGQMLKVQLSVDLGGTQIGMTEQFLNGT